MQQQQVGPAATARLDGGTDQRDEQILVAMAELQALKAALVAEVRPNSS